MDLPKRKIRLLLLACLGFLVAALSGCSSDRGAGTSVIAFGQTSCGSPVPLGAITGFGVNGQPRNWGSDGRAVKPALNTLVDDLGADFFRVEVNNGETTWETTNDDGNPNTFNWAAYDAMFSTPAFQDLWDYIRYLNALGVPEIQLSAHGDLPGWMYTGTQKQLAEEDEDEFVETEVAMMVYGLTRTPLPRPVFTMFSPFNEPEYWSGGEGFNIEPSPQGIRVIGKLVDRMNHTPELSGIGLVISESANEFGASAWDSLADDPIIKARLRGISFHRYGDGVDPAPVDSWINSDPPAWLTEFNSTWHSACYATTWTMGMEAASNLLVGLQQGVTAGLAWSDYDAPHVHQADQWQSFGLLATTYQGNSDLCARPAGQPTDAELDVMTYTKKPTYIALRHAFKWIRRGAVPVTVSDNVGSVDAVAYKNTDASVVVFGRNNGNATTVQVTLGMANPPSTLTPHTSTASTIDQIGAPVTLTNGVGSFSLPATSVFTLLSSSAGSGGTGGAGGTGGTSGAGGSGGTAAGNGGQGGQSGAGTSGAGAGGQSGTGAGGQSGMSGSAGSGGASAGAAGAGAGGMSAGSGGQGGAGASGAGSGGQSGAGAGGTGGMPSQVSYVASSLTQIGGFGTSIGRSTTIQGGDLEILIQGVFSSTATSSALAGFTQFATVTRTSAPLMRAWAYAKTAAGTPGQQTTDPTSYNVTNSASGWQDVFLFAVRGQDPSTPILPATTASGKSTGMSVGSINVPRTGSLDWWWKIGNNTATTVFPAGRTYITQSFDASNDGGYKLITVAGDTNAVTGTQGASDGWLNFHFVIQPSP